MEGLIQQLKRWHSREWLYRLAWGLARALAFVFLALFICCLTDWWIDRSRETPLLLRVIMTVFQLLLAAGLGYFLVYRLRVPTIVDLATVAEKRVKEFGHRLVTAIQLNAPEARTEGMSRPMIDAVTAEAEALSARHDLKTFADIKRITNAAFILIPLLVLVVGYTAWKTELVKALIARQCLLNADIPRSIAMENATTELWPSGDEVVVKFAVKGAFDETATGKVRVRPEGLPAETYPLAFAEKVNDEEAIFTAKLPASSVPFSFRATLQDGRTKTDGKVRFEPRPVVDSIAAAVVYPEFVGKNPEGKPYGKRMPEGDIVALPGYAAIIAATFTKPVETATIVFLKADPKSGEQIAKKLPMDLIVDDEGKKTAAQIRLPLDTEFVGYRIECTDANGFGNAFPPRRNIGFAPDEPPRVALLQEVLKDPLETGPLEDYEVNGMPLKIDGQVQIGYTARSPWGLKMAHIQYKVNDGPWQILPLRDTVADVAKMGKFVPELGVFEKSGLYGQVEFYAIPSELPETIPSGLEAGGRYNFQVSALQKLSPEGLSEKLSIGDRVEFYVEVFDRNPAPGRLPGRSESRLKSVVTATQLEEWTRQRVQTADRLRMIEERQRKIFTPKN